jgi:hypothetical protein
MNKPVEVYASDFMCAKCTRLMKKEFEIDATASPIKAKSLTIECVTRDCEQFGRKTRPPRLTLVSNGT